jgi:uracil-DNA glycosylase
VPNEHFTDEPKLLGNFAALEARLAELYDSHIAPLTAFVKTLRAQRGLDYKIPYFDPWDGGIAAEILFLLEAPGPKARDSGFISRNNPDETAKNFFLLNQQAGIPRKQTITWNIVPWYLGSASRIRPANPNDIDVGILPLKSLLDLLPKLLAIVLVGKKAQHRSIYISKLRPEIRIFNSWHPSPRCLARYPGKRDEILIVLREVAKYLDISSGFSR